VPGVFARILPQFFARTGIETVQPVVAGAEVKPAVRHARARLDMALRLERPQLLAGGGIEAEELAGGVLVEALADVDMAVGDARRREHLFHFAVVVELPELLARLAVETVEHAGLLEDAAGDDADVNAV